MNAPAFSNGGNEGLDTLATGATDSPNSRRIARPNSAPPSLTKPASIIPSTQLTGSVSTITAGAGVALLNGNLQTTSRVNLEPQKPISDVPVHPSFRQRTGEKSIALPSVHFWTRADSIPQLDYRDGNYFTGANNGPGNLYGGAVNNGCFRGFRLVAAGKLAIQNNGFWFGDLDLSPQNIPGEWFAINHDDDLAAAGKSAISSIQLSGSGIFWGPESSPKKDRRTFAERMVSHEPMNNRSYLKGPVRITADYIRFDGPVSRIGSDVTLNARRIVINGVELPASEWRQALGRIVQSVGNSK